MVTLEEFLVQYTSAPMDIKQAMLEAGARVLDGAVKPEPDEHFYTLKEVTPLVGLHHYGSLSRLQVQRVGVSYGGRLVYRLSDVRRYLLSAECMAIRNELRRQRNEQKGGKHAAAS